MSLGGLLATIFTGGRYGGSLGPTGDEPVLSWRDARVQSGQAKDDSRISYDFYSDPYYMAQFQYQQDLWNNANYRR